MSPKIPAITIFIIFICIGFFPLFAQKTGLNETFDEKLGTLFPDEDSPFNKFQSYKTIYEDDGSYEYGPYGVYPALFSLFIPLAFAFGIGYYLRLKYRNVLSTRNKTKELELQFPSATFQLGNRINEGISAELAFGAVADTMRGTEAGEFFSKVDRNIKFSGMSVENALFDEEKGAIMEYPSELVISSMKIFIRATEKGPEIAASTLIDLSRYLTEIHAGQERMRDLLAESLGSMKSQASFLAPVISGVVVAIISLITLVMGTLAEKTAELGTEAAQGGIGDLLGNSIPTFLFQSVVGLYIASLIAVLVYMISTLEHGNDPVFTEFQIGSKLIRGMQTYTIIAGIGIIFFSIIGANVLDTI